MITTAPYHCTWIPNKGNYSGLVDMQQLVLKFCPNNSTFRRWYKICNSLSLWLYCFLYLILYRRFTSSSQPIHYPFSVSFLFPSFLFHFSLKHASPPSLSFYYLFLLWLKYAHLCTRMRTHAWILLFTLFPRLLKFITH